MNISILLFFGIIVFFISIHSTFAANPGSILSGYNEALVTRDGTAINFGLFSNNSAQDVLVYDTYLKGYAWGEKVGWISLNCANETVNDCSNNGNFHVSNTTAGVLSGWAWGQKTGWINFGPFSNNSAQEVVIASNGEFVGWAWGQKIGWIKFDCGTSGACVKTDWQSSTSSSGGGGGALLLCVQLGTCIPPQPIITYPCSDLIDNDGDGLTDLSDSGCVSFDDMDEVDHEIFQEYACSDLIDNDGDGQIDYLSDSGCIAANDNNEYDPSLLNPQYTCTQLGNCIPPSTCNERQDCPPVSPEYNCITLGNCPQSPPSSFPPIEEITPPGPPPGFTDTEPLSFFASIPQTINTITQYVTDIPNTIINFVSHIPNSILNSFTLVENISFSRWLGLLGLATALASIPIAFWRSLFAFFYRNKRRPWGTVYDSVTKQPLDPAYVVLKGSDGKDVGTAVTDLDGRYGFLQAPGNYTISSNKTHYIFPSKTLFGKTRDELYNDLYFGESFEIQNEGDVIMKNIPMDPLEFDWNQLAKEQQKRMKYYHKRDVLLARISNTLFYVGFGTSLFAFAFDQSIINIVIIALYAVLFVLRNTVFKQKASGMVVDTATNLPIPFAIIRVFFATINTEVSHMVTNEFGKYYKLISNGDYYITIEKKNEDGSYTKVFTSETQKIENGVINKVFMI